MSSKKKILAFILWKKKPGFLLEKKNKKKLAQGENKPGPQETQTIGPLKTRTALKGHFLWWISIFAMSTYTCAPSMWDLSWKIITFIFFQEFDLPLKAPATWYKNVSYDHLHLLQLDLYCHKQETSALHVCLFIPNACRHFIQMFCFNNVDHSAIVCAKQKSIRWTLAQMITQQAPVAKIRKSQNQYLVCSSCFNHRSTSQHHWIYTLLKFYEC